MPTRTLTLPPQEGRTVIVTGTGGLGLETARAFASAGAQVVVAGRNPVKGAAAKAALDTVRPGSGARFEVLDLASLSSVAAFADRMLAARRPVDVLINNAGLMAPPSRSLSADGFELQLATNYLGHFALTARLMPLLLSAPAPRVVCLSSLYARIYPEIDFDDLQSQRHYSPFRAYAQSKLSMLMLALELDHRVRGKGRALVSNAAHPGYARTDLIDNGPAPKGVVVAIRRRVMETLLSQSAAEGAMPTLYAATSSDAVGGGYYGPRGLYELKGRPGPVKIPAAAMDADARSRLWRESEALCGITFDV